MRFYVNYIVYVDHEKFKALDKICIHEISFGDGKNNKFFHKTLNDVGISITFRGNFCLFSIRQVCSHNKHDKLENF